MRYEVLVATRNVYRLHGAAAFIDFTGMVKVKGVVESFMAVAPLGYGTSNDSREERRSRKDARQFPQTGSAAPNRELATEYFVPTVGLVLPGIEPPF